MYVHVCRSLYDMYASRPICVRAFVLGACELACVNKSLMNRERMVKEGDSKLSNWCTVN